MIIGYVAMLQRSVDDILRLKNKPYLASFLVKCRTKIRQLLLKTKPHIENSIYQHTFRARNYSLMFSNYLQNIHDYI
ncbi:MAG TPA: hypothetical protein DGK91_10620 [Clostridium sp.]|nr:hypothetical protein [Clostridium sp.]